MTLEQILDRFARIDSVTIVDELSDLMNAGYVHLDFNSGYYTLTEKGYAQAGRDG